jgi:hypothetical protein
MAGRLAMSIRIEFQLNPKTRTKLKCIFIKGGGRR